MEGTTALRIMDTLREKFYADNKQERELRSVLVTLICLLYKTPEEVRDLTTEAEGKFKNFKEGNGGSLYHTPSAKGSKKIARFFTRLTSVAADVAGNDFKLPHTSDSDNEGNAELEGSPLKRPPPNPENKDELEGSPSKRRRLEKSPAPVSDRKSTLRPILPKKQPEEDVSKEGNEEGMAPRLT